MTPEQFTILISELRGIRLGIYWAAGFLVLTVILSAVRIVFAGLKRIELEGEELFKQEASLLYDKNKLEELMALCRNTLEERPNNPYARWYLAHALVLKEDWPGALEELAKLRVSLPSWADVIEPVRKDIAGKMNKARELDSAVGAPAAE